MKNDKNDFYDSLPRFVNEPVERIAGRFLDPLKRQFIWESRRYDLVIFPAFVGESPNIINYFPSEREEEIEKILRQLSTKDNENFLASENTLHFTLSQIKNNLIKKITNDEIELAIEILATVNYELSTDNSKIIIHTITNLEINRTADETYYQAKLLPILYITEIYS